MNIKEPGGHLDQMFRQTRQHHVELSSMADVKANILLTLSSVVITLSVRYITEPYLKWPAFILISFCLVTIVFSVYIIMPKVPLALRRQPHPDVRSPRFNILFFGDFVNLDYSEFEQEMEGILNEPSQVYEIQLRELYTLGTFLAKKKYRFVRLAYLSFLSGLLGSGILMLVIIVISPKQ